MVLDGDRTILLSKRETIGLTESHNFTHFVDFLYMVTHPERWSIEHPAVIYAVIE